MDISSPDTRMISYYLFLQYEKNELFQIQDTLWPTSNIPGCTWKQERLNLRIMKYRLNMT